MSADYFADLDEPAARAADDEPDEQAAPLAETSSPGVPMAVAEDLMGAWRYNGGAPTLLHWRGTWMRWEGAHWAEVDDREIRSELYRRLQHATFAHVSRKDGEEVTEDRKWAPNRGKIANLSEALAAITHLSATVDAPAWITSTGRCAPGEDGALVACTNGLLRLDDRTIRGHDPRFFNLVSVPFAYQPDAPEPARWLHFLSQLWPGDNASVRALQEWFGYVLSGRTDLHKIMLIIGPARSGKGTIGRILTALVGKGNMAGPTLASMATNFGLSPLLGKPLAVVSDARLSGRDGQQVVERLLTISGEDTIDIDRKYRDPWTGRLPTRFLILSNELPNFGDASGAIATRFVVLSMNNSFLGNENTRLTDELMPELPGILNWALEGLARLVERGHIEAPDSSNDAVVSMQDMASPVSAFVRECCDKAPANTVLVDDMWSAWKAWAEDNGVGRGNKSTLSRNLSSVVPGLRNTRPHGGKRQYVGVGLNKTGTAFAAPLSGSGGSAGGSDQSWANNRESGGSGGSSWSQSRTGGASGGSAATDAPAEPPEPLEPPENQLWSDEPCSSGSGVCAEPGCTNPPRRSCRTCAQHMDREGAAA